MSNTSIPVTAFGLDSTVKLFNSIFSDYHFPLYHNLSSITKAAVEMNLDLTLSQVFLCNGTPMGLGLIARGDASMQLDTSGWLYCFGLQTDYRSKGLGRGLLRQVLQQCADIGITKLGLEVLTENTAAIRLYEREGFKKKGELLSYRAEWPLTKKIKIKNGDYHFRCIPIDTIQFLGNNWDIQSTVWSRDWPTLLRKNVHGLACIKRERFVGYIVYNTPAVLAIHRLAVCPEYRRRGLATALMERAHQYNPHCTRLTFTNVSGDNALGKDFLTSIGFTTFAKQLHMEIEL